MTEQTDAAEVARDDTDQTALRHVVELAIAASPEVPDGFLGEDITRAILASDWLAARESAHVAAVLREQVVPIDDLRYVLDQYAPTAKNQRGCPDGCGCAECEMAEGGGMSGERGWPVRQKSAQGQPPEKWDAARTCVVCKASFRGLAPGKTGERGLWDDRGGMRWFCSQECRDTDEPPSRVPSTSEGEGA